MTQIDLITTEEVMTLLKVSRTNFETIRREHNFPAPMCLTTKSYRYSLKEVKDWLESRREQDSQSNSSTTRKQLLSCKKSQKAEEMSFETFNMLNGGPKHGTNGTI